ncbi:mannitol/fructose-specific phosphotransferase system IIA component (Ntr-type) [Peribacillus deserti]|uniref:Ascorbate-specific PTS system EIIA component n=1 Tax=Peribacillus deserti TaxID=673318 RepID=A0ABS2QH63_9BACI|nr:PTS sugar transporter subunit IIA [Peribacillus deserti]MBM7692484.1 mannitol/fructose-specific phosphotransferase system IIA component (Ntr-type) [Peribacillus deserti]
MLRSKLTDEMVQFIQGAKDWEEAIRVASEPLLKQGYIEARYVEAIISNVKNFGPYIVLMPKVAMPHARPEDGVNQMGISLLLTEKSVSFDEEKAANIFFVLAADDESSHLDLLKEISEFLTNEEKVSALLSAKKYEDVIKLL